MLQFAGQVVSVTVLLLLQSHLQEKLGTDSGNIDNYVWLMQRQAYYRQGLASRYHRTSLLTANILLPFTILSTVKILNQIWVVGML